MKLEIKHVSKKFNDSNTHTLSDINFTIESGQFVTVVGTSGCGKSTLLNLIAGLDYPTEGEILLNGSPIKGPGAERTVMFQDHGLYPWLNVIDNVKFGMKINKVSPQLQEEKAQHYLEMMHLSDYKNYRIHELSGGMRQRVALARALTMDSEILLMDEPFSALDKQTSNRLREELQNIWQQTHKTIFFITHSVEEAIYLGDKVIVLQENHAGIRDEITIDLPRPRHVYDEQFVKYRKRILGEVREEDSKPCSES